MAEDHLRQAICSHVARLLREERTRQNLSLSALSARAGLSRQMVSYVEQQERNPTLETLLRLTGVLGVNLEEILKQARRASTATNGR
jgi:transcriptional regulator with XRE-family HTH domain